ncbi:MAG: lipid-A-disaccharide synthase [Rhodospirillaceae bacterium]
MTGDGPLICIVTGEPSGDLLGARLMTALTRATSGRARFMGVGGESMQAQGLDSLADQSEFAVMGFVEVVPKAARILRRVREIADAIAEAKPDVMITVDSWGFTGRLNRAVRARALGIPQIHYVAPMVWAWKERRAVGVAATVDHLLCLLPNEPPYFERHGLACTHVGHPVVEGGAGRGDAAAFRASHGIPPDAPLLCVLPGSRRTETGRLLPVFATALGRLRVRFPNLHVVAPTVATVAADVERAAHGWPVPTIVVRGEAARYDAFAAADAAMAASGTVGLELALAGVPHLVAYKVSAFSAWLLRRLVKVRYVNLVNLALDRPVVPELLQEACTGAALAAMVERLLTDEVLRTAQRSAFAEASQQLAGGPGNPSDRAAAVVLRILGQEETAP